MGQGTSSLRITHCALRNIIDAAAGRRLADLVIKNCRIVNVLSGEIHSGSVAVFDGKIIGMGKAEYDGAEIFDAQGKFLAPGFIDGHIHIESSYISPEQLGRIIVPRGTTSIIADPHEIANVCGLRGIRYMLDAAKHTRLNIIQAMPSCVPATPFEDAGAVLDAEDMVELLGDENIFGLGEFMNAPGVINCDAQFGQAYRRARAERHGQRLERLPQRGNRRRPRMHDRCRNARTHCQGHVRFDSRRLGLPQPQGVG